LSCNINFAHINNTLKSKPSGNGSGGGGGGFSGGGSSGSGDGGAIIELIIWLIILHPQIGIPLALVAVAFFIISSKTGHSAHISHTIKRGYQVQNSQKNADGLKLLLERDPAFTVENFTKRCKTAFPKVQMGWSNQNMTPARHIVSDGIYERFQLQLEMQKASCLHNVMENISVTSAEIIGIQSDTFFDTLHVKISASAIDYLEDTNKTFPEVESEIKEQIEGSELGDFGSYVKLDDGEFVKVIID
jgi:hypothetical protein